MPNHSGLRRVAALLAVCLLQGAMLPQALASSQSPSRAQSTSVAISATVAPAGTVAETPKRSTSATPTKAPGGPKVALRAPAGALWRGRVDLSADVQGTPGGNQLTLLVDGRVVESHASNANRFTLDTARFADGPHLVAVTVDDKDLPLNLDQRQVSFDNSAPVIAEPEVVGAQMTGEPLDVRVRVDDHGSGLSRVQLMVGDKTIEMKKGAGDLYAATVPGLTGASPYKIQAEDAVGNVAVWPAQGAARIDVLDIPSPESLSGTLVDGPAVELNWQSVALPDGATYVVHRSAPGTPSVPYATVTEPRFIDTSVSAGNVYAYSVAVQTRTKTLGAQSPTATISVIPSNVFEEPPVPAPDEAPEEVGRLPQYLQHAFRASPAVVGFGPKFAALTLMGAGPTSVGGTISTNTTWTAANSPYIVTSNVIVNTGVTLTIEPGTIVKFNASTYLQIKGSLQSVGQSDNPIIFTSAKDDANGGDTNGDGTATTPAAGDWYYIESATGGTANLQYAQVLYAGKLNAAIYGSTGAIQADHVTVQSSLTRGIQLSSGSVTNSTVSGFATYGVYVSGGTPSVTANTISGGSHGVYVYAGTPSITDNQISSSSTAGIYFYTSSGSLSGTLTGNTVTETRGYAVDFYLPTKSFGTLQVTNNTFTGNTYNGYGISGTLSGTNTLPVLDYPYISHGLTIGTGATLTVSAGTIFKVAPSTSISNSGTLNLNGTSASPIIFTSVKDDTVFGDTNGDGSTTVPAAGNWSYITGGTGSTTIMQYVQVLYGGSSSAAVTSSGTLQADRVTVQYSNYRGIQLAGGSVTNSTLSNFASEGIYVTSGSPTVDSNSITGGNYGVYVYTGSPSVTNNQVTGSATAGVYFYASSGPVAGTLTGNTVTATRGYAVDFYFSTKGFGTFQASGNTFSGSPYNGFGISGTLGSTSVPILEFPYVVHSLAVASGATVTVPTGAVFKSGPSSTLTNNGTLNLNGTSSAPIIFTSVKDDTVYGDTNGDGSSSTPSAGNWGSLTFGGGAVTATYVTVRYGGSTEVSHTGGTASLDHVTVSDGTGTGIQVSGGATLSNSTVSNVPTGVRAKSGNPSITDNTITATSQGIYVEPSTPIIQHNTINNTPYGIYVSPYSTTTLPSIADNTITGASNSGIYLSICAVMSGLTLTGNSVNSSKYAVTFNFSSNSGVGSNVINGNQFTGNQHDGYQLSGTLYATSTFYQLDYPFFPGGFSIKTGATTVLNPGVIMKMGAGEQVTVNGVLDARGTADQPVVFTSIKDDTVGGDSNGDGLTTSPAPGDWYSVVSYGQVFLDHVRVFYGGGYPFGAIHSSDGSDLRVTNSEVAFSRNIGIDFAGSSPNGASLVAGSSIHDNSTGIYTYSDAYPTVSGNDIFHNGTGVYAFFGAGYIEANTIRENTSTGVYSYGSASNAALKLRSNSITGNARGATCLCITLSVDARFNWWGDESGPAPVGKGDYVGSGVAVGPWLGREYQDARQFGSAWWTSQVRSVNMVTGNYSRSETDLTISGGKGFPTAITRTYNSLSWTNGSFGHLWRFNYDLGLKDEPDKARATATYGSGQEARFTQNADGTYSAPAGDRNTLVKKADGSWELTTKDHSTYSFDTQGRLITAADRNGNATTLGYGSDGYLSTITDAGGRQVTIGRDSNGRITQMTDPAGNTVSYTYDSAGNLATVTDVLGHVTTYAYDDDHRLLSVTRPGGIVEVRVEYDEETRVSAVYDGVDNKTTYSYDPTNRSNTVTDPRGNPITHVYDSDLRLLTVTDPLNKTATKTYDTANNLVSVQARDGGITTYAYDGRNNLTSQIDALGKTTTFTYDSNDNLKTVADPLQAKTQYDYDAHNNRITQTDPLNRVTHFEYNTAGLVTKSTDPLLKETLFEYDSYGNLTKTTDPLLHTTSYTYDVLGRKLTQTDALNGQTTFGYDKAGHLLSAIDSLNGATLFEYDALGRRVSVTDPEGRISRTAYDNAGRVTSETNALNKFRTYTYDPVGNRATMTDELNHTTQYAYSVRNELTQVTDPGNNVTKYGYDANGNRTTVTDPNGYTTIMTFDLLGRVTKVTDPDQVVRETTEYDPLGRVTAKTDGNGKTTNWTFDLAGQLTKVKDPLGNETTYAYDDAGNRTTATDALNHTVEYGYDAMKRLTSVTLPQSGSYTYGYDPLGRMTSVTDPNNHAVAYEYDPLGRLTAVTDPLQQTTRYTYDKVGNRLTITYPGAVPVTYAYDAMNRLTSVSAAGGPNASYEYDNVGHRTKMTDETGATTYGYDAAGRLTTATAPDQRSVSYGYDPAGNVTQVTDYKGNVSTRTYDKRNRLATVTAADGTTAYSYNGADQWLTVQYPGGVKAEATYDGGNRLSSVVNRQPDSGVLSSFTYTYDALGQRTSVVDNSGTTQYAYDSVNRLNEVTEADGRVTQYSYDGAGNRLTRVVTPAGGTAQTTQYGYDAADRITSVTNPDETVLTHTLDARGNLTSDGIRSYAYDGLNRLVSVEQGGQTVAAYRYNGDGLRYEKTAGGATTRYYYDGDRVLNEGDGTSVTASQLWGLSLIRRETGGQAGYYLFNGHPDVVGVVSGAGAVLASYQYDDFGTPTQSTGTFDNPFRYTSEPWDAEIGAVYLRARYYQPAQGRFMTQDSWRGNPWQPWTQNLYVYVGNNPVNMTDPTGHRPDDMSTAEYAQITRKRSSEIFALQTTLSKMDEQGGGHVADYAEEIYDLSHGVPEELIGAIMEQESKGDSLANNSMSHGRGESCCDGGKGLMQVDLGSPKPCGADGQDACGHWEDIPGDNAEEKASYLYNPRTNLDYAVGKVLAPAWSDTGGNVEATLRRYNGGGDPDYVSHVMNYYAAY